MLKKVKSKAKKASTESASDLSESVLNSSHQIWLAGLGAFSRAQAEGMKVFETLVRQGERLEEKTRRAASDTAAAARGAARAKAKEMQQMAGGTWDKLEQVFEDRVERALSKLGVYTQNDVQRLAARVDELSDAVNALLKAAGKPAAKPAAEPAKKRTAAKTPAAAKAARKPKPAAAKRAPK
jgi:poly(hydroxyalkanoate) granule-associated protein